MLKLKLPLTFNPQRVGLSLIGLVLVCLGSPNRLFHSYSGAILGLAPIFYLCDQKPWRQQVKQAFPIWFFFCLFVFLPDVISVRRIASLWEIVGGIAVAPILPLFYLTATLCSLNLTRSLPILWRPLGIAAVWTAIDGIMGLIWFPIPFHWGSLLYDWTVAIQIADLTGMWGVTFFAVFINAWILTLLQTGLNFKPRWAYLGLGVGLTSLVLGYGSLRLSMIQHQLDPLNLQGYFRVGAVQQKAWLDPDRSWAYRARRYQDLRDLSLEAVGRGAELLVWSEGSLRAQLLDTPLETYLFNLMTPIIPVDGGLILGAAVPDPETQDRSPEQQKFINSALLFNKWGELLDQFGKQWLFTYFETARYVPSEDGYRPLNPGSELGPLGVMICLESVLPEPSRRLVQNGAQSLITISDDIWFGNSNWPKLHGNLSIFRAIENRRSFVFVNNTGGNLIIEPTGRIQTSGAIFEQDVVVGAVYLMNEITLYNRWGDWFSWCTILISAGLSLRSLKSLHHQQER